MSDSDSDSETTANKVVIPEEIQKEIGNFVKDWVHADDQIKGLNEKIKELKEIKQSREELILGAIETYNLPKIQVTNGVLRKGISATKEPLKPEQVLQSVKDILKESDVAQNVTSYIFENRKKKERVYLKRTSIRQKKTKT
jgi:hypothetical protein